MSEIQPTSTSPSHSVSSTASSPTSFHSNQELDQESIGNDLKEVELDQEEAIDSREQATESESARTTLGEELDQDAAMKLKESILESLSGPDSSIPPELLSPPASRDPSPRRAKSKSPARWKLMRSISDAVQDLMGRDENGMYGTSFRNALSGMNRCFLTAAFFLASAWISPRRA